MPWSRYDKVLMPITSRASPPAVFVHLTGTPVLLGWNRGFAHVPRGSEFMIGPRKMKGPPAILLELEEQPVAFVVSPKKQSAGKGSTLVCLRP